MSDKETLPVVSGTWFTDGCSIGADNQHREARIIGSGIDRAHAVAMVMHQRDLEAALAAEREAHAATRRQLDDCEGAFKKRSADLQAKKEALVSERTRERDALRARLAKLEGAISRYRHCAIERYGEGRCPESWAKAMGGTLPFEEQRKRWCVGCDLRAALADAPGPGEKLLQWIDKADCDLSVEELLEERHGAPDAPEPCPHGAASRLNCHDCWGPDAPGEAGPSALQCPCKTVNAPRESFWKHEKGCSRAPAPCWACGQHVLHERTQGRCPGTTAAPAAKEEP